MFPYGRTATTPTCCRTCRRSGAPLLARYDLDRAGRALTRAALSTRPPTMWRYREVMPIRTSEEIVSLGEGFTPLLHPEHLGRWTGFAQLYIKDESPNPTGSFKARGLSAAVTCARARGAKKLAIPTAGNAGGAMAAYAAACGLPAIVFMPRDTPMAFIAECRSCGAEVELVDGLISDCGRIVGERKEAEGWFEVSTLKEPYRIEGKKTLGYELAEQMDWSLPDVVIYPTGGGTGLIGMWKAFAELEQLGWIGQHRPRMISVQAEGCAPIVRAFAQGHEAARGVGRRPHCGFGPARPQCGRRLSDVASAAGKRRHSYLRQRRGIARAFAPHGGVRGHFSRARRRGHASGSNKAQGAGASGGRRARGALQYGVGLQVLGGSVQGARVLTRMGAASILWHYNFAMHP